MNNLEEIHKFRIFNKLKSIYRFNSVENRKESTAEHSWSTLILADFFLTKYPELNLDKLKVYEYIMYHDVVEIYAGDTPLIPGKEFNDKHEREEKAAKKLHKDLPEALREKYYKMYLDYESQKTKESRFVKAIDALDAEIHEMDYKEDWIGWSKEFLYSKKMKYFEEFPQLKEMFIEITEHLESQGYFDQSTK
jgi:putative hydrolase of HD superfamily